MTYESTCLVKPSITVDRYAFVPLYGRYVISVSRILQTYYSLFFLLV